MLDLAVLSSVRRACTAITLASVSTFTLLAKLYRADLSLRPLEANESRRFVRLASSVSG